MLRQVNFDFKLLLIAHSATLRIAYESQCKCIDRKKKGIVRRYCHEYDLYFVIVTDCKRVTLYGTLVLA